jgi:hypothetical protein
MSLALGIAGRNLLPYRSGYGAQVIASNNPNPFGIPGGATIDWNLFSPLGSPLTLPDTELMLTGWRFARYGQIFCRVTNGAANVLTLTGATGGTFVINVTNSVDQSSATQTTAAIPFNATALVVKAALEALFIVGTGNTAVTGPSGGPYNITFAGILGTTTVTVTSSLTGSSPTAAFTTGAGGIPRSFGPYDPSATGTGRDVLNIGDCFILNRTKVMGGSLQLPLQDDMHTGECVVRGSIWGAKVLAVPAGGTPSLANGPTWTALKAAMPMLEPVYV